MKALGLAELLSILHAKVRAAIGVLTSSSVNGSRTVWSPQAMMAIRNLTSHQMGEALPTAALPTTDSTVNAVPINKQ